MATWPSTLPQCPIRSTVTETPQDASVRSQPEAGPTKARPRFTAITTTFEFTLPPITSAKVDTLMTFYTSTLGQGSVAFDWKNPRTQSSASVQFLEPPKIAPAGSEYWIVSMKIAVLP